MILVTNPGTLAAIDPFGSWGELAGGWSTWPLSPPGAFCVEAACLPRLGGRDAS